MENNHFYPLLVNVHILEDRYLWYLIFEIILNLPLQVSFSVLPVFDCYLLDITPFSYICVYVFV